MRSVAAARYDPDVEAALLAHFGVTPEECTLRRLHVLLHRLPAGAWPNAEEAAGYTPEAHLLAALIDAVREQTWVTVAKDVPRGKPRPARPAPLDRPWGKKKKTEQVGAMSWPEFARWLGGRGGVTQHDR